jgi:hypothetical protein
MALTSANLVGYLRAEFARASKLRIWLFFVQLAAAIPPAVSVLVPDHQKVALYWLAIIAAGLLVAWWVLNGFYVRIGAAAQAARRGALLLGGLNEPLSPSEIQSLRERLTVTAQQAAKCEKADYYATTLPPGAARLGEMLEESALYSEHLQRWSARIMLGVLSIFGVAFFIIAFAVTPFVQNDTTYLVIRAFMAFLVFAMSADAVGAYWAHKRAAEEIKEVRKRLTNADKVGYPMPDVLLAFTDYNAAVEKAPESVPYAYALCAEELDRRWKTYQEDRANARAAR